MFEKKIGDKLCALYFISLAAIMYYLLDGYIVIGKFFVITYRHALALLLIVSACVCFLVKPNVPRAIATVKVCLAFSAPTFVFLVVSMFNWCYYQQVPHIISRGLSSNFIYINHFASVFAAGVFLYMFGEKGIWYHLFSILVAHTIYTGTLIAEYGFGAYMSELIVLVRTFSEVSGSVIAQAEFHELAFCLGLYLVYMLLFFKKNIFFVFAFSISTFYFISAFKRIAIIAIVIAVPLGILFILWSRWGNKKTLSKILTVLMIALGVALVAYVGAVKLELFDFLEAIGIDTKSRAGAYRWASHYYEFSPSYIGRGIGFLTYQIQNDGNTMGMFTIHNDFLQYYVDLGFWGYILWLFSMTVYRLRYFGKNGHIKAEIFVAVGLIWVAIVSSTDNTLRYPLFITTMAILMMGTEFDACVKAEEKSLTEYRRLDP